MTDSPAHSSDSDSSNAFFDEATQRQLAADDSEAWRAVTTILIAIVSLGLAIGLFAVVMVM